MTPKGYAYSGGAVGPNQLYISRPVDEELTRLFTGKRTLVNLRAPRQSGKSSLAERLMIALHKEGHRVVPIDLRVVIGKVDEHSNTPDKWYGLLFRHIARELGISPTTINNWSRQSVDTSPVAKVCEFFATILRKHVSQPILFIIDEIDFVMPHGYHTDYLFEALRNLFKSLDEHDMSFLLAGISHPSQLVKASGSGAFNIGHDVVLTDFGTDDDTLDRWSEGLDAGAASKEISRKIIEATGGQPFLTAVLHNDAVIRGVTDPDGVAGLVAALLDDAHQESRLTAHFNTPAEILGDNTANAYEAIETWRRLHDEPCDSWAIPQSVLVLLQMTGLTRSGDRTLSIRNPIYRAYFDKDWIEAQLSTIGSRRRNTHSRIAMGGTTRLRICLINTGGTLGMERQSDGTLAQPTDLRQFYSNVPELDDIAEIDPLPLMCKDGINMSPDDWKVMAEAIFARRDEGYAGFVVCHGTDTLAYSAAAVAFAFGAPLRFPIVFTGAQAPMDVLHGDARSNLIRATKLATKPIPEVCVAYSDKCFRAVRTQKTDDYRFEGFVSATLDPLAIVTETIEIKRDILRPVDHSERMRLRAQFEHRVLKVQCHPGLDPDFYRKFLDVADIKGLVLETPGIGNIPFESHWSLLPLIHEATGKGIPVLITSQFPVKPDTRSQYRPAMAPLEAGAVSAGNMTAPAALVKFMWAIAQTDKLVAAGEIDAKERLSEIKAVMGRDIIGEVDVATNSQER
ncbi:MAG: asparaginase [Alphaproteobacteria bacterium]|nr:asparaginase [Alphaproteobacteria bacterium]